MVDLKRWRWKPYAPNLGNNLEQEKPFTLRLKAGLAETVFSDWTERWVEVVKTKDAAAMASILSEVAEMGPEALAVEGVPVATLEDYLRLCLDEPDQPLVIEVTGALRTLNCIIGQQADFSARLSGGSFTTPSASPGTAAPQSGSGTRS